MCELVPKGPIPPCIRNLGKTGVGMGIEGREMKSEKAVLVPDPTTILSEVTAGVPQTGIRNVNVADLGYTHRP